MPNNFFGDFHDRDYYVILTDNSSAKNLLIILRNKGPLLDHQMI